MKIFRQIKKWLCPPKPPKPPTLEQMGDLLDITIKCLITEDFHLVFGTKQQFILAWIGNRYCPISFKIITLFECRNSAKNFVDYVKLQLRKADIEL